ncbi:hypothetical protein [Snodgrassella communis]|uniref:Uncharacterized protein n=1 Tax=Snodgrassella alvi TaxID=1196083 RepID=A0A2N9XRF2_9NEIS|nr:hypothetical protein [Snodgrassella communis]PIT51023.1 hypothetical protein BHC48_04565 [Snodgrassella communis]
MNLHTSGKLNSKNRQPTYRHCKPYPENYRAQTNTNIRVNNQTANSWKLIAKNLAFRIRTP